ncbi:RecQ family ATP-dependent DNA helicase [Flavobacteriales bacterium]|nr:RecQ family ATP-dependent DNA helicase [Flavobacteriales bacterium]
MSQNSHDILKQYWGYDSFRDSQEDIINSVLDGNNTLALLPTGGGKSICYQVPGMLNEGICIVVSPLIALMKDQVENLNKRGIKALAIFSGMNKREIDIALDNCVYGDYKFLYVSPERLQTEIFQVRVAKMKVNLIAVDESHCISQWGHDFRPAYQKIKDLRDIIDKSIPFLAVTATANKRVIDDVSEQLSIEKEHIIKQSFARDNLGYLVLQEENKKERLIKILKKANSSSIVYTNTRKSTMVIAHYLCHNGISADYYHGGLGQQDRDEKQKNWIDEKVKTIVATNAFGMGIDKPNVRIVVHMELPASPEAYFQEAGRAGRDGKKSFAALLYKPSDKLSLERFHELEFPELDIIKKVYNALGNYFRLAIGGGQFSNYEFNITEFCNQFNFQVIIAHHCLSILALADYIFLSEAIYRPSRVKSLVSNSELYTFQVRNAPYEGLIQFLLRKNEGIFDSYCKISPYLIGNALKKTEKEVETMLTHLTSLYIIDYQPASDVPLLTYTQDRAHEDRLRIPKEIYADRKRIKKSQLDFMLKYCESEVICRSKLLLSYFDETEFENCEICDVCLAQTKKTISNDTFSYIEKKLIDLLQSKSKSIKDLVNSLNSIDEKEVIKVIRWKLDNNEFIQTENHQLKLTKKEV